LNAGLVVGGVSGRHLSLVAMTIPLLNVRDAGIHVLLVYSYCRMMGDPTAVPMLLYISVCLSLLLFFVLYFSD